MKRFRPAAAALLLAAVLLGAAACSQAAPAAVQSDQLNVVATTTIVGDVVKQVGGDAIALTVLLPTGSDPHAFEPSPQDAARVATAQVVFANGVDLERFLDPLLQNAGGKAEIVSVSDGIDTRALAEGADTNAGEMDPHVWTDPNNVIVWTQNIEAALTRLDPAHAAQYKANAEAYRTQLTQLDGWVREQVAQVPPENRKLVTDHQAFGYFGDRYGFEQVGAVFPGFSTMAEPSSQELAALEDAIRQYNVKAVFVGTSVNPSLAQRVATDTGLQLVSLYTGSLSAPGGDADSYIAYTHYNVSAIVGALK